MLLGGFFYFKKTKTQNVSIFYFLKHIVKVKSIYKSIFLKYKI